MPLERRNEPQMLRQFQKHYPSFNLNPLLRRRHQQLVEARALNEWLANRRLQQEGETYADEIGRMTEAVNRRIPQLRYAPAERQGVHRMARDVAAGRNSSDSQVLEGSWWLVIVYRGYRRYKWGYITCVNGLIYVVNWS